MNIICSSSGVIYAERPVQGIMDILSAGFENTTLDFAMFCPPALLEQEGETSISSLLGQQVLDNPKCLSIVMEPLIKKAQEGNLRFGIGWGTSLPSDTKREDQLEKLFQILTESIHICGAVGCPQILVQPIYLGQTEEEILRRTKEFYLRLAPVAKENKVMILFSNQPKNYNGHLIRGLFSDGAETARWIDECNEAVGEERFGFSLDCAVCSLCGQNMFDFAVELGPRIKTVTLSDCSGEYLAHLMPFSGARGFVSQTDWLSLIRGLRAISYNGDMVIDFCDTVLSFSPLLRPQVMQLAKATAEFLKWQVEIENVLKKYPSRVLFGAGNMCRNYMKCYGQTYPPLYTCDNNPAKWETEFCGLRIKSPEHLKTLHKDTAIFICNVYYREIEQELRDMGITNPIEYFNDEYMPSFHYDRVEDIIERSKRKEG